MTHPLAVPLRLRANEPKGNEFSDYERELCLEAAAELDRQAERIKELETVIKIVNLTAKVPNQ